VLEILRDACGQFRVRVEAAPDALPGWASLTVRNLDLSLPDPAAPRWVFGTLEQALEVLAPPAGPTAVILGSRPAAGQQAVSVSSREVRVQFDRDLRPLAEALDAGALRRAFRVLEGKKALPQAPGSPAFEDEGRTVVIRLRDPLQAGLRYATAVDLAGASLRAALERAGHGELAMRWAWSTLPGWKTIDALVSAEARSGATAAVQPLAIGAAAGGPQNAGVAPDAEFRLRFAEPVWGPSVSASTIRLLRGGHPLKAVEPPRFEDGGRTVVIRPGAPLAPGASYRLQVRTGAGGVRFQVTGGGSAPIGAPRELGVRFEIAEASAPGT
jgi:hypothetical protein